MELGNLAFGNSRGEYHIERGAGMEAELTVLFNRIDPDHCYAPEFENEVFAVRPYYWGDCTCGYEQAEWAWSEAHKHADGCYQHDYRNVKADWLKQPKAYKAEVKALCEKHGIPYNNGLGCAVHCTCDHDRLWHEWRSKNDHKEDCPIVLPNFHYKPTDYRLKWYKYPLRDSYANQKLSLKQFAAMIDDCKRSLSASIPSSNNDAA